MVWTNATVSVEAECHDGPISYELQTTLHQQYNENIVSLPTLF